MNKGLPIMNPAASVPPDIYENWLGIPSDACPPNYYVLLGLPLYESDLETIKRAGDERIKLVRPKCFKHREVGTRLLNEIAMARVCLTDRDRKGAYDESLRQAATRAPEIVAIQKLTAVEAMRRVAEFGRRAEIAADVSPPPTIRLKRELREQKGAVGCLAFDPQGVLLASAGHDGTTRIWNFVTGLLRATLEDSADPASSQREVLRGRKTHLTSAAFSPDGAFFATAGEDTTTKLWDVTTGKLRQVLQKTWLVGGVVTALAFQPHAPVLAAGYKGASVKVWDVEAGKFVRNVAGPTKALAFSPDGMTLATSVGFWDFETGNLRCKFQQDLGSANCLLFSPDGTSVVTGTATGIHFWDPATGAFQESLRNRRSAVRSLGFSSDGFVLAAGLLDGAVEIWDMTGRRLLFELKAHSTAAQAVAFSPDNSVLATGGADTMVKLWDVYAAASEQP